MMWKVLFTSSFRRNLKRVLECLFLIGVIVLGTRVLNYVYCEPYYSARIMWRSFYAQDNIDTVFLGSSHVYFDIDVKIVDELTGKNSFDMATSTQRIQESYYNLLEADRNYDIESVYIELYYRLSTLIEGDYSDISAMRNSWRNTDFMRNSICRIQGIWNMNDNEHLIDAFIPFVRYRAYLFDWDHISDKLAVKRSEDYKNYRYHCDFPENGFYEIALEGKGFAHSTRVIEELTCEQPLAAENMEITSDAEKYLRKVIEYCQEQGIALTLFISPIYEIELIATEGYDVYLNSVQTIAEEYQLPIYDFNLIKREYLTLDIDDFHDIGHFNSKGAEKFTRCFWNILNSENKDVYFYNSFSEKLKMEEPRLYGAYWINNSDGRTMKIAASDNPDMEFEVILNRIDEEGTEYETSVKTILQNFNVNRELSVPKEEHGTVTISWRMKGETDIIDSIEFTY